MKHRITAAGLQGWPLFWLLAGLVSVIEMLAWRVVGLTSARGVGSLIGFNWRLAVPYFLLAFSASSLQHLFPSALSRWLLANRRYVGLAFAVVCGWQLAAISMLGWRFPNALAGLHRNSFQFVEDAIFAMVLLMTVTSFRVVNRHISAAAWRRIHKTGIYSLGALFTLNYFGSALDEPNVKYIAITSAFFLAWLMRFVVWWRQRRALHGWELFWTLSAIVNVVVVATWSFRDLTLDADLGLMIRLSTQIAAAAFLIVLSADALQRLVPGRATAWLLANRRYFFLVFALAFGWYLFFAAMRGMQIPKGFPAAVT